MHKIPPYQKANNYFNPVIKIGDVCFNSVPCVSISQPFTLQLGTAWFCGVVVITSALHAEGREFEPRQNLAILRGPPPFVTMPKHRCC